MFGASFAGFAGTTQMVLTALLALAAWGVFIGLALHALLRAGSAPAWASGLAFTAAMLSIGTAFLFGFGAFSTCGPLFLAGYYHFGGMIGAVLGFGGWFVVRQFDHRMEGGWKLPLILGSSAAALFALFWVVLALILSGSIDDDAYPDPKTSAYKLPYPKGDRSWVIQGNSSGLNHEGNEEHAWDFRRRCGTPVLAARAGRVTKVVQGNSDRGGDAKNNEVQVTHDDGTVGRYMHIQKDSAVVALNSTVAQGQELAKAGNVGNSLTGHIHFHVERGGTGIPISFNDVSRHDGIPRTFRTYASGNR
jgi:hypothetical protein